MRGKLFIVSDLLKKIARLKSFQDSPHLLQKGAVVEKIQGL